MTILKLEHSCLVVKDRGGSIGIDPGCLTGIESRKAMHGVDAVMITHEHADHLDLKILAELGAPIIGPEDVIAKVKAAGLIGTPISPNQHIEIGEMKVSAVTANHGPAVTKPLMNVGFIIEAHQARIYVTSDLAGEQPDAPEGPFSAIALPVEGGGFDFDAKEAVAFLQRLGHSGIAIALHADDAPEMRDQFRELASSFCKPLALGVGDAVEV